MKQSPQKTRKKIGNLPVIDSNLKSFYDSLADLIAQEILADEDSHNTDSPTKGCLGSAIGVKRCSGRGSRPSNRSDLNT
jgi:hypothetical protein